MVNIYFVTSFAFILFSKIEAQINFESSSTVMRKLETYLRLDMIMCIITFTATMRKGNSSRQRIIFPDETTSKIQNLKKSLLFEAFQNSATWFS